MSGQASLLRLPRELRQQIYDYLLDFNQDHEMVVYYNDEDSEQPIMTVYRDPLNRAKIPWVSLLLTCRLVYMELSAYMESNIILGNESNRTYTIKLLGSGFGWLLYSELVRIPCSPSNVEVVRVNIFLINTWSNTVDIRVGDITG
ncbi:hypothetical protein F4802DRAFT_583782 [Xylaria palmicola]|nr:hypothetical protein F4802DRAFT_583782 [Xylaria palmicola]